jgi:hypothetical protein
LAALYCPSCKAARDSDDNFCRRCGRQITVTLPAVTKPALPVESRGIPPSLIGSVAVLAIGTGLEWLARRLAGNAARGAANAAGRALIKRDQPSAARDSSAVVVKEVLYVRQTQLRR